MKRVLGVTLALVLAAFAATVSVAPADASDPDATFDALVRYFLGEIDRDQLEAALAPQPPDPGPGAAFSQALHELGDDYAQATHCGDTPDPRYEAFLRDPLGTDWDAYETVYCNLETGEWVTGRVPRAGVDYAWDHQLIGPGEPGYDPSCYYTNSAGERAPAYQVQLNPDGTIQRNADGSVVFIAFHGGLWDPIARQCQQRAITPAR